MLPSDSRSRTVQLQSNLALDTSNMLALQSRETGAMEYKPGPKPSDLLEYLPAYKVLICTSCKYGVKPDALDRHLKEIHRLPQDRRRPLTLHASKFNLASPDDVLQSKILEFPVPLLPVQEGLMCESEDCHHLCVSVKRMKAHWTETHGRTGRAFLDWHPVPLQTFFRGSLLRYFTDPAEWRSRIKNIPHCELRLSDTYRDVKNNPKVYEIPLLPTTNPQVNISLDESDAQLFQHYISSTGLSISNDAKTEALWQVTVPQLALQHPFLLHGLLALSALHLAHLSPTPQPSLIIKATTHQSLAMPLFRAAITDVSIPNSEAVLVFSHLLVLYTFASESQDERLLLVDELPSPDDDILPPWLYFLRNGCALLCEVWDYLETSPVNALAEAWEIPLSVPTDTTPLLAHLLSLIPSPSFWSEAITNIYTSTAYDLAIAFTTTAIQTTPFTTWDAIRVFPMRISIPYISLLKSKHPAALILLAHYCILLRKVEGHWYFEGRAQKLLGTVVKCLGSEWWEAIRWPLEEIGVPMVVSGSGMET